MYIEGDSNIPILTDSGYRTEKELVEMYRKNLKKGDVPVAGYFCPMYYHEVNLISGNYKCHNYDKERYNG